MLEQLSKSVLQNSALESGPRGAIFFRSSDAFFVRVISTFVLQIIPSTAIVNIGRYVAHQERFSGGWS